MGFHTNEEQILGPDHNPAQRGQRIVIRLKR